MSFDRHIYNSGPSSSNASAGSQTTTRSLHLAKVVEVLEGNRIRARISGLDNRFADESLPICHPLLPIFLKVNPLVGELIDVLLCDTASPYDDRRWVGPVITQYTYLPGEPCNTGQITLNRDGFYNFNGQLDPRTQPDAQGLFSDEKDADEQVWTGRGTTDISQKPNQIRLRSGKHEKGKNLVKNQVNPATLALHTSEDGKKSAVAAVADKFYFLGHQGSVILPQTRSGEIDDALIEQMETDSSPATLYTPLAEFLDLQRQVLLAHAHGYDGSSLIMTALVKKLAEFDLTQIGSKTMRLN
jgi:hypothetical protein